MIFVPATMLKSSSARWPAEPMPAEPPLSDFVLASVASSPTLAAAMLGCTHTMFVASATFVTGARSRVTSKVERVTAARSALGSGGGSWVNAALVACGPEAPVWAWGNVARGLLPLMERLGVEGAEEVRSPDLDERMLAELCAHDAVLLSPMMVGAWTRVPGV